MKYISGIHALNIRCALDTCGDWHQSSIQWEKPTVMESDNSVFGDFGIETNKKIPNHEQRFNVANHIRALLDLLATGAFGYAQGMKRDFICNDSYNELIFRKVLLLTRSKHWEAINQFLGKEYGSQWLTYWSKVNAAR